MAALVTRQQSVRLTARDSWQFPTCCSEVSSSVSGVLFELLTLLYFGAAATPTWQTEMDAGVGCACMF